MLKSTVDSVNALKDQVERVEKALVEHDVTHKVSDEKIGQMLDVWQTMLGFIKVVNVLGNVAKWLVLVGVAIGGVWAFLTHGGGR